MFVEDRIYKGFINPYQTTFGKLISTSSLEKELNLLVISFKEVNKTDLSYGIKFNNLIPIIITGKTNEERNISPFIFPYTFKDGNGRFFIAIDVREYVNVKSLTPEMKNYDELVSAIGRIDNLAMLLRLSKIMSEFYNGTFNTVPYDDTLYLYSSLFVTNINNIAKLTPIEELEIRTLSSLHAHQLLRETPMEKNDEMLLTTKIMKILRINHKDLDSVKGVLCEYMYFNYNKTEEESRKLNSLLEIAGDYVPDDKRKFFSSPIFINQLQNMWYGPCKQSAVLVAFECLPMFIALVEAAMKNTTFKASRLTAILNRFTKVVKFDNYIRTLNINFDYTK